MKKGILHPLMATLAGAGLALLQPALALAGDPVVRVAFEDDDQKVDDQGKTQTKPETLQAKPQMLEPQPAATESAPWGGAPVVGDSESYAPPGRFWAEAEYLLWWIKNYSVPPLITQGSITDVSPGALGQPGTVLLYGGSVLNNDPLSGGRFTGGMWLDCDHTCGIEGDYFFLGEETGRFLVSSNSSGSPVLARPFINAVTGQETAEINSAPGMFASTKEVLSSTEFQGAEGNAIWNLCCGCRGRLDLLAGFRWLQLEEKLGINELGTVLPGGNFGGIFSTGNTIAAFDQFNTTNNFYGGQVGLRGELGRGPFFVNGVIKVALGDTHEVADINGLTTVTTPTGGVTTLPGGLLALPSNSGRYTRDRFAVVPEAGLHLGYQLNSHLRFTVGYTLIYWSDVVRPGNLIDRTLNPNQIQAAGGTGGLAGGPARPAFVWHDTDFWAQGLDFGVEYRY